MIRLPYRSLESSNEPLPGRAPIETSRDLILPIGYRAITIPLSYYA
jgi:hypothetical protein